MKRSSRIACTSGRTLNPAPDQVPNAAPHFTQYVWDVLDSRLGEGSTFTLVLPAPTPAGAPDPADPGGGGDRSGVPVQALMRAHGRQHGGRMRGDDGFTGRHGFQKYDAEPFLHAGQTEHVRPVVLGSQRRLRSTTSLS